MKANADVIEIPTTVWDSAATLDELEDWLMAKNPHVMRELLQARRDDLAGKFKARNRVIFRATASPNKRLRALANERL